MFRLSQDLRPHSRWDQLSPELWRRIFAVLAASARLQQREICKLPLICTSFQDILAQLPHPCKSLRVSHKIDISQLPHLFSWIQRYAASLEVLDGSHWTQVVLSVLLSHACPLLTMSVSVLHHDICLIAGFKTLKKLTMCGRSTRKHVIDLQPLRSLPNLDSLHLQKNNGHYSNLDAIGLTQLTLSDCHVICSQNCEFATSLRELHVLQAKLLQFHEQGVAACSALQHLDIEGIVGASNQVCSLSFDGEHYTVPENLTLLTALVSLRVLSKGEGDIELGWLTRLTALQKLQADLSADLIVLPECMSAMSKLRDLCVSATADYEMGRIECMFDWKTLVSLESIELYGRLYFDPQFGCTDLLTLRHLKEVTIIANDPGDEAYQIDSLGSKLAVQRPDVRFSMCEDC